MGKADLYALDVSQAAWGKSSCSVAAQDDCVEAAQLPGGGVTLRDSKNAGQEPLRFTAGEWSAFRRGIEAGEP